MTVNPDPQGIAIAPWFVCSAVPQVSPGELPCQYFIGQELDIPGQPAIKVTLADGKVGLLVRLLTPNGMWANVLPPDFAIALGEELVKHGKAAQSGLFVVG